VVGQGPGVVRILVHPVPYRRVSTAPPRTNLARAHSVDGHLDDASRCMGAERCAGDTDDESDASSIYVSVCPSLARLLRAGEERPPDSYRTTIPNSEEMRNHDDESHSRTTRASVDRAGHATRCPAGRRSPEGVLSVRRLARLVRAWASPGSGEPALPEYIGPICFTRGLNLWISRSKTLSSQHTACRRAQTPGTCAGCPHHGRAPADGR
jgi:hypothetical protein